MSPISNISLSNLTIVKYDIVLAIHCAKHAISIFEPAMYPPPQNQGHGKDHVLNFVKPIINTSSTRSHMIVSQQCISCSTTLTLRCNPHWYVERQIKPNQGARTNGEQMQAPR